MFAMMPFFTISSGYRILQYLSSPATTSSKRDNESPPMNFFASVHASTRSCHNSLRSPSSRWRHSRPLRYNSMAWWKSTPAIGIKNESAAKRALM